MKHQNNQTDMDFGETLMATPDNVVLASKSEKDPIYNEKWELVENRIPKTGKPSLTLAQNASRVMSLSRNIVERVNGRMLWQNKASCFIFLLPCF